MIRFGFLAKKLTLSLLQKTPKNIRENVLIGMRFSSSKNIDDYFNDLDIAKSSLPILVSSLKTYIDNPTKLHLETKKKIYQIVEELQKNLDKLDPQSIIIFCEWLRKCEAFGLPFWLSKDQKNRFISCIDELISNQCFDRTQILTISENLFPLDYKMDILEYEVEKMVYSSSDLTLKEISQIIAGSDNNIYKKNSKILYACMKRISELKNQEELDEKYLAKILDVLKIKNDKIITKKILEDFLKIIEKTLPSWKLNSLFSIINLYKNHKLNRNFYLLVLERIDKLLNDEQPIDIIIKLISLLKEETKRIFILEKIISNSLAIINSKLSGEFIGVENLINILGIIGPIINYQDALLLESQINHKSILYSERLKLFQKASNICVNNEGKVFPLTDFIPVKIELNKIQNINIRGKLEILYFIVNTKNFWLHGLQELKNGILNDLKTSLLYDQNAEKFCDMIRNYGYNSELAKNLQPLQAIVYPSLLRGASKNALFFSMMFYESSPKKWEEFVIKNKKILEEGVYQAFSFHEGSFEAIIFLLKIYKDSLSPKLIGKAMQRVTEIQDVQVLNDFAYILNQIDPRWLLNHPDIYSRYDCFLHLFKYSDFSLMSDLFSGFQKLLKDLPINVIFSNYNIKYLSYNAPLGTLDLELADRVVSNYTSMKHTDYFTMLMISSKCSNEKLRENVIKKVFNDKLGVEFIKLAIEKYAYHPENKEIENFIIEFFKKIIANSGNYGIYYMKDVLSRLTEKNKRSHLNLFNELSNLTKDLVLKNIGKLNFASLEDILNLADLNMDLDFADIICKNQQVGQYSNNDYYRERLIEKIKTIGLSNKNVVLKICNKNYNVSPEYLSSAISCLADLSLQNDEHAINIAKSLIIYTENNRLVFENDTQYTNWIYGLLSFNADKSVIMRHLENSKYFDFEKPIFKHFLLKNHFLCDSNYNKVKIYQEKTEKYWKNFDYFKHFGIDKPLIELVMSSFNKVDLEVKPGEFIEGIWVPFYVPMKKAVFWPVTNSILLYRSNLFRGEFAMHKNQMLRKIKNLIVFNKEETKEIDKLDIKQRFNI